MLIIAAMTSYGCKTLLKFNRFFVIKQHWYVHCGRTELAARVHVAQYQLPLRMSVVRGLLYILSNDLPAKTEMAAALNAHNAVRRTSPGSRSKYLV